MNWERSGLGLLIVLSCTVLGALFGLGILGRLLIDSTGFDAIADALGYLMLGGAIGFFGGFYLAWHMPMLALRRWAVILFCSTILLIGLLAWYSQRASSDATSEVEISVGNAILIPHTA